MIKINLLGTSTVIDYTGQYIVAGFVASVLASLGVFYMLLSSTSAAIDELNTKTQSLQSELAHVQKITKEVKDLETKKAEFNRKLVVIAKLKKNKLGPVRVLDDLNMALPEKAWLTEVKEQDNSLQITGRALDNQTVATFIRELEKSDYFGERSNEILKQIDQDGVKIKEFSFLTKIYYAGKTATKQAEQAQAESVAPPPPAKGKT
jgi:type IV pilus assembly protein PilN